VSRALDVNLLLYASDEQSPHHEDATRFLESVLGRGELFYLCWPTVMSYLRIATHPSIFRRPLTPAEAQGNISTLVDHPYCRLLGEEEGFWEVYMRIASTLPVRGNLVPDAHVAAILAQQGVRKIYTRDTDFLKFPGLQMLDPFESATE